MRRASADVRPPRGFTLIEMLVAIAIFGIMAGFSYRILDSVLTTRDRVGDEHRRWRDVARAVGAMERDLEAILARPVRNAADQPAAPLVGVERPLRAEEPALAFTRMGDRDEFSFPGAPRRTGYRVRDTALERLTWPALDAAPRGEPVAQTVLDGVRALEVRYLARSGQWTRTWPAIGSEPPAGDPQARRDAAAGLPAAVDVTIELSTGERIRRLVPLQGGARS